MSTMKGKLYVEGELVAEVTEVTFDPEHSFVIGVVLPPRFPLVIPIGEGRVRFPMATFIPDPLLKRA